MLKRLLGLIMFASIACVGVAHAQGTATTKPAAPIAMPAMPAMPTVTVSDSGQSMTGEQLAAIGVGAVVGVVLFQGAMWHGMVIVGAAIGGYVGDYLYTSHTSTKTAS